MGNYDMISIKIGTQTKKKMRISKVTKALAQAEFQDGRRHHVGN
jgi:hypothetical protein